MGNLTVSKDFDGMSGIVTVCIEEILFLKAENGGVSVHTPDAVYYSPGTLRYWTVALNSSGYHFILSDRNNSINMRKIVEINKLQKLAYFDTADRRNKASKYATMSTSGYKEVQRAISETNLSVILA